MRYDVAHRKNAESSPTLWTPLVVHELLAGAHGSTTPPRRTADVADIAVGAAGGWSASASSSATAADARGIHLTGAGQALAPLIRQLTMGPAIRRDPLRTAIDVTVLVWNMRRRVGPDVFPSAASP